MAVVLGAECVNLGRGGGIERDRRRAGASRERVGSLAWCASIHLLVERLTGLLMPLLLVLLPLLQDQVLCCIQEIERKLGDAA